MHLILKTVLVDSAPLLGYVILIKNAYLVHFVVFVRTSVVDNVIMDHLSAWILLEVIGSIPWSSLLSI